MNLVVLAIFTNTINSLLGALSLSYAHGFTSAVLFFLVGLLYDRFQTKLIWYYSGICQIMPVFSIIFCIFILANIGLPLTFNFIGEFLIFIGIFEKSIYLCFFALFSIVLGVCYNFWLFNRVIFSSLKIFYLVKFQDLNKKEILLLLPLCFLVFFFGIFSDSFL